MRCLTLSLPALLLALASLVTTQTDRLQPAYAGEASVQQAFFAAEQAETAWQTTEPSLGRNQTCGVNASNTDQCLGLNRYGHLDDRTPPDHLRPVAANDPANLVAGPAGLERTCGLDADGATESTPLCGGGGDMDQMGGDSTTFLMTPAPTTGLGDVTATAAGNRQNCGSIEDGTMQCRDDSQAGRIGDGTLIQRPTPVAVAALTDTSTATSLRMRADANSEIPRNINASSWVVLLPFLATYESFVTVIDEAGAAVEGAEVWVYRDGQRADPVPAITDAQGYALMPRLRLGDRMVALLPLPDGVRAGWPYRVYVTSLTDGEAYTIGVDGERPMLVLKKSSPLFLFDLVVSLEWCDDQTVGFGVPQQQFVRNGLAAVSRYLYDVTDGQFAFGKIDIYDCAERWQEADVQILASSYVRPWANTGGIVADTLSYVSPANVQLKFAPGHIRMARTWTRDGSVNAVPAGKKVWFDNPDAVRAFTHEFLHYAAFLFDQYIYSDANGAVASAVCTDSDLHTELSDSPFWSERRASVMDWPYNGSELDQEGTAVWTDLCKQTEQYQQHGESSWDTLIRMYSDAQIPARWLITSPRDRADKQPLAGPQQDRAFPDLPVLSPVSLRGDVSTPLMRVQYENGAPAADQQVQVFLVRQSENGTEGSQIVDLGSPDTSGYLLTPGLKVGDVAVAVNWDGKYSGITQFSRYSDWVLTLSAGPLGKSVWSPLVTAQPISVGGQMTGLAVQVCGVNADANISTMIVPVGGKSTMGLRLAPIGDGGCYGGTFDMGTNPIPEAHLWVCQQDSADNGCDALQDQFTIVTYALGDGSPGSHGRSYVPSTSNGYCTVHLSDGALTSDAPVLFMTTRSAAMQPPAGHKFVSTPCYVGLPADVNFAKPIPLLLYYNETELLGGPADSLGVWRWDDVWGWQEVPGTAEPDRYTYFTALQISQPGIYVVTTKLPSQNRVVQRGPDISGTDTVDVVNAVRLGATSTVADAFPPECQLEILFTLDPATEGGILRYIPGAPDYVNTLQQIEAGQIYYAQVGVDCVVGSEIGAAAMMAEPPLAPTTPASLLPTTYYGSIFDSAQAPMPGALVLGRVNGRIWGQTRAFALGTEVVYVLDVPSDDPLTPGTEGIKFGDRVRFQIDDMNAWGSRGSHSGDAASNLNLNVDYSQGLPSGRILVFLPTIHR